MGINYKSLASTAKRLLGGNGTKCILINPGDGPGEYNPSTNEYDKKKEQHNGYCIISEYKDELFDGTIIKTGDRKVMAVLPVKPIPKLSKLEIYNKTGKLIGIYLVINSTKVNPDAATVILYKLQCRE